MTAAGQAQIQTVPANAAAAGYPANVVAAAQTMADQQAAQVPQDVQTIDTSYNLPASPLIPSTAPGFSLTDPTTWPLWLWLTGGLVGSVVVLKALR